MTIVGSGTTGNVVVGDEIGTNSAGTASLGNSGSGVYIAQGASNNTIGGYAGYVGTRDLISGNASYGVEISDSGTTGNLVENDYIGTDVSGTHALGNTAGIFLTQGASYNTVSQDVISGNMFGVVIFDGATGNWIESDAIGTDPSETQPVGNTWFGIYTYQASGNYVVDDLVENSGYYGVYSYATDQNDYFGNGYNNNAYGDMASF